jgi:hypothetical protein
LRFHRAFLHADTIAHAGREIKRKN